ncbi:MAG: phytanoyl-CoA dioxygenase family protein [Candidatus Poribacteria bacterium]|nr:phytanoyl-CoA dioxygenase family protein [Candidatus Poribacteria bacterium]
MITEEQIAYFQTFGFLVLRQAFGPDEMNAIGQKFDDLLDKDRGGQPFPGVSRQALYGIAENVPLLTSLVEDDRIYKTVESLLGDGFIWLCSEGNLYVGNTDWHPDGTRLDYRPMKVSLYLDALTPETGCLRVIPGSHRLPLHDDLKPIPNFGIPGTDVPCFPLESQPGDVFFLDMNTWHASFSGGTGRRHLALNFVPKPTTAEDTSVLKENHQGVLSLIQRLQYRRPGRVFSDAFLDSDRPRIQRLTAKWIELGLK